MSKIKITFDSFLNEGFKQNETYDDFVETLYSFESFFDALEIEVNEASSISFSFSLSLDGYVFAKYIPCLKYDTPEFIMEKTILPNKQHWYNLYLKNAFMDFIENNGVKDSDIPVHQRLYVYKNSPLETIPFHHFKYKNGSQNYNRLSDIKLFDHSVENKFSRNVLFRVK